MSDINNSTPLSEINVKLCAAVKKFKCLHDLKSIRSPSPPEYVESWELVAKECNLTVDFCKKRWKNLRRCFFEGVKSAENKYYFHDHLTFLLGGGGGEENPCFLPTSTEETESIAKASLQKNNQNSQSLQKSEIKTFNTHDNNDAKSVSSWTSADDCSEIDSNSFDADGLGLDLSNESIEEELGGKRSIKSGKRKHKPQLSNKSIKVRLKKLKLTVTDNKVENAKVTMIDCCTQTELEKTKELNITDNNEEHVKATMVECCTQTELEKTKELNITDNNEEHVKVTMVECCTQTELKPTKDFGTQYELTYIDLDDAFLKTIKTHLAEMNSRQKMNFKRKIYQSFLEVFDDANEFPSSNEALPLKPKETPCIVDTTTGEMRLMRELVALVQAAKSTPEIVDAKAKAKPSTPAKVKIQSPASMPLPTIDDGLIDLTSNLPLSPSADDDDLQFFIDNLDDEDDLPLPLSWDELKEKHQESTKVTKEDNAQNVPLHVVRKVVKPSDSRSNTINSDDDNKKRVFRIFPQLTLTKNDNSSGCTAPSSTKTKQITIKKNGVGTFYLTSLKNGNSSGSSLASSTKTAQLSIRKNGVGTFYVPIVQNSQDMAKFSNNTPNINSRLLKNIKPINQTSNTMVSGSQPGNSIDNSNAINCKTVFKNVHPENLLLCPKTGSFQPLQTTDTGTSTGITTISTTSKPIATKLSTTTMPSTCNAVSNRVSSVLAGSTIAQGRYAISDLNTFIGTNVSQTSNDVKSSISQIQISQPRTITEQTLSSTQKVAANIDSKARGIKFFFDKAISTKTSNKLDHKPILETAGTVAADDLDPLVFKTSQIKTEPVDT